MVDVISEVSGLELEGWVAVGFEGFLGLMEELGSLEIDLPTHDAKRQQLGELPGRLPGAHSAVWRCA